MAFSLGVLRTNDGPVACIQHEGQYYDLQKLVPSLSFDPSDGLIDIVKNWDMALPMISASLDALEHSDITSLEVSADSVFDAPVRRPGKVICAGTNYHDHLTQDMKMLDFDKSRFDILYFMKHPQAVVGSGPSVRYPSQSRQLDWEIELVVVFGQGGRRIPVENAIDYVAGYMIGIDLSARDWQFNKRHPKGFDLLAGKSFDDSAPVGPWLVPAQFVDPSALDLKLWVNGKIEQDSNSKNMIWSLEELISELSEIMTIEPGDLLFTGSPAGVGMASHRFLEVGDMIDAEIEGLGRLSLSIRPDPDASQRRVEEAFAG